MSIIQQHYDVCNTTNFKNMMSKNRHDFKHLKLSLKKLIFRRIVNTPKRARHLANVGQTVKCRAC